MATIEVKVPDIGDFKDVPVISVLVKPGDTVAVDDPLVELESDKATMEVPSPRPATSGRLRSPEGDKVAEGVLILLLEAGGRPPPRPRRRCRRAGRSRRRRRPRAAASSR